MANLLAASVEGLFYQGGEALPIVDTHLGKLPGVALDVPSLLTHTPDLYVLFMIRDPRAVLTSIHPKDRRQFWAQPARCLAVGQSYLSWEAHERRIDVRFEDLVTQPDEVQTYISERLALPMGRSFSTAYHYFRDTPDNILALGGPRPLDPSRVRPWEHSSTACHYLLSLFAQEPALAQLTHDLGYRE